LLVDTVDRNDVGVVELRRGLGLANESRAHVLIEGDVGRQHLDRHRAIEARIDRAIHDGHPATPDLTLDEVLGADRDGDAIVQIIVHGYRAACPLASREFPRISSETMSALSTLSA